MKITLTALYVSLCEELDKCCRIPGKLSTVMGWRVGCKAIKPFRGRFTLLDIIVIVFDFNYAQY